MLENIFGLLVAFVLAAAFLILAYKFFDKDQKTMAFFLAMTAAVLLAVYAPAVQGFLKTGVLFTFTKTLNAYGERLNDFQTTIGQMKGEVTDLQTKLKDHQKELESQQEKLRTVQNSISDQQSSLSSYVTKVGTMQNDLASNQKTIAEQQGKLAEQQKKIEDVEFLVNNLFSKTVFETISGSDTNRFIESKVKDNEDLFLVAFRLGHVPIPNSVRIIQQSLTAGFGGGQAPLLPISATDQKMNVVSCKMKGGSSRDLIFHVQYVRDTRAKERVRTFRENKEKDMIEFVESEPDN